jgi:hypothetical protein
MGDGRYRVVPSPARLRKRDEDYRWRSKSDPFLTIASYWQPLPHPYQKLSGLSRLNNLPNLLTSLPTFTYLTDIIAHFSIDHTTFPPAPGPLHGSRANTERLLIVNCSKLSRSGTERRRAAYAQVTQFPFGRVATRWGIAMTRRARVILGHVFLFARVCDFMFLRHRLNYRMVNEIHDFLGDRSRT